MVQRDFAVWADDYERGTGARAIAGEVLCCHRHRHVTEDAIVLRAHRIDVLHLLGRRRRIAGVFIQAVTFADIPVMAAYLCLIALIFVVINLVVDLLYFVVDPRLRVGSTAGGH